MVTSLQSTIVCSTTHTENVVARPNTAATHWQLVLESVSGTTSKKRLVVDRKFMYIGLVGPRCIDMVD